MHKILIIEDSPDLIQFLELLLKIKGNKIETLPGSNNLDEKLLHFKPDIILLDVQLFHEDGRDICKKIKNDSRTNNIKIILLSANPELLENYEIYAADAVIEKPFDIKALYELIENVLKK